jgi:hypothetical protein
LVLKRIHPRWPYRIAKGKYAGLAVFMGITGLSGTVFGVISGAGQVIPVWSIIVTGVCCTATSFGVAYVRGQMELLPDSLVDDMSSDGAYTCTFITPQRLREACDLTEPYYGDDYVPGDIAVQWWNSNPKGFTDIANSEGVLCASFGILALKDSFMDLFLSGRVTDSQLRGEDIHNLEDSKKSSRLYISGVVVRDPSTYKGSKRARVMVWAMLWYIKVVYGLQRKKILYTLAVTKESDRLLKHMGFQLVSGPNQRIDKGLLYSYELTKDSWNILLNRVGDCSLLCKCNF